MSRDCTCQRWRCFSALVCLYMCLSSLHSLSLLLVHFKTPDKHKEWRDAFNDLFCRAPNESEIRGVFHWHGPKCQQIGDLTQQQEERVRRHSVWCPILAIWQGRGWKKGRQKGWVMLLMLQSKTWSKGVFPSVEGRDFVHAPVKVLTIFTCAKCESALLAL